MGLVAYGINHSTAPLAVREQVSFNQETMAGALFELKQQTGVREAAILSTCNRTELYCSLDRATHGAPVAWLHHFHGVAPGLLRPFLYQHPDENAVRHVLRVASGLDSMILGEPQVLGQLKDAYKRALAAGAIGHQLNRLFQHSFRVAKEVRNNTAIGNHPVSVAYAAVRLAQQIFGELKDRTALLVGAGETIELAARHLHENGLTRMIIANRGLQRSEHLARQYSAYAIPIADLPRHLAEADIVLSATASPGPVLHRAMVQDAIGRRGHRPVFMVDIAVPRDIEAAVGELDDVYLYSVDDLKGMIRENLQSRQHAAKQAEKIIDTQAQEFMGWLGSLDAVATIRALRDKAGRIQAEVIQTARKKLHNGAEPEQVLLECARALTNKLLHAPSARLRNISADNRPDLLQATEELFALDQFLKQQNPKP